MIRKFILLKMRYFRYFGTKVKVSTFKVEEKLVSMGHIMLFKMNVQLTTAQRF